MSGLLLRSSSVTHSIVIRTLYPSNTLAVYRRFTVPGQQTSQTILYRPLSPQFILPGKLNINPIESKCTSFEYAAELNEFESYGSSVSRFPTFRLYSRIQIWNRCDRNQWLGFDIFLQLGFSTGACNNRGDVAKKVHDQFRFAFDVISRDRASELDTRNFWGRTRTKSSISTPCSMKK